MKEDMTLFRLIAVHVYSNGDLHPLFHHEIAYADGWWHAVTVGNVAFTYLLALTIVIF